MATRVDEAEAKLKSSEEHAHFLKDKFFKQSHQQAEKDAFSSGYPERAAVLEKDFENTLVKFESLTTQHMVDRDLPDDFCTAITLHMTASQQRIAADVKDSEKLLANRAAIDTEFCQF